MSSRTTIRASMFDLSHPDSLGLLHRQTTVLELIASGAALPEVLTAVTAALEELIPDSRCSILLLDAATRTLHHGAAPTLPPAYAAAIDGLRIGEDAGSCGAAAYLDAEVVAEDVATDRRWVRFRDLALPHGLRACWSHPIRGRTGILGTFAVYHGQPHRPTERERRLIEQFTHLASVAIDHDRLYAELAESEERFRRAFEDNAVGMALTALDGRFGEVNRALQEMLGRSERELLAADVPSLLHPDADDTATDALGRLTAAPTAGNGDPEHFETILARPDGTAVQVAVTASTVLAAGGTRVYLLINVLDVTARRAAALEHRARREAELARGVAEAASRAKSEFLSALSHEIRTPLQAITGFTELLGTLDLPAERRTAALGHIASASSHILALVDDVLDIAKIEAGALPLRLVDVDLADLVGEVVELLEPVAGERGVRLRAGPVVGAVHADRRLLRQILLNLVTNGARYNHSGGWVLVTAKPDPPDRVAVRVSDSGPGIPEELIERVFVPFDRLNLDDGGPGTGLGMVLARRLAEAMGGTVSVTSTSGHGTTMEVRLAAAG